MNNGQHYLIQTHVQLLTISSNRQEYRKKNKMRETSDRENLIFEFSAWQFGKFMKVYLNERINIIPAWFHILIISGEVGPSHFFPICFFSSYLISPCATHSGNIKFIKATINNPTHIHTHTKKSLNFIFVTWYCKIYWLHKRTQRFLDLYSHYMVYPARRNQLLPGTPTT